MSVETGIDQGQTPEDRRLPYGWELDFADFEIWLDNLAELRESYTHKARELKVEHANPSGVHHSTRYEVELEDGSRIYFYEPQDATSETPDLTVRNYSRSRTAGTKWEVNFHADQQKVVALSNDTDVDFESISEGLETAVSKAVVSQIAPRYLKPYEDIPARKIPTRAPDVKS